MAGANELERDALTYKILGCFFLVYRELGFGFLESVYQEAMRVALRREGLSVMSEVSLPIFFLGERVGVYRADMIVDRKVLLEIKAAAALDRVHRSQILNYLKATDIERGLLLNFGPKLQFERFLFTNERKEPRPIES